MRQQNNTDSDTASEPRHIALAREAVLAGMSREQVIEAIIKRIRRDEGYLAYRKASGRRTSYDELVTSDLQTLALAACWLDEGSHNAHGAKQPTTEASQRPKASRW